jgi:hypothetical protein
MKSRLLGLILDRFRAARRRREELSRDPGFVDSVLRSGSDRARAVAGHVMAECRRVCGFV